MTIAHSIASKNRWKNVSPEERKRAMSLLVRIRWTKASKEDRKKVGKDLAKARKQHAKDVL